jgi:predicted ribosome quality control (RQC) complex YloA/Tae2 family protein
MPSPKGSPQLRVPFDSLTLFAVIAELRPLLIGGQIQDIRQPEPHELLITIRSQGRNLTLLLSCDARFARVHLTSERKPNSTTPPSFCTALRRHMDNGRILDVRQRDLDRIFELEVQSNTEDGMPATVTLVAELMGKHSNLILINERGIVVEAAKRISHRINRFRETLPGKPYLPPPIQTGRLDPLGVDTALFLSTLPLETMNVESLARTLAESVAGMSPFLAQEIGFRTFQNLSPKPDDLAAAVESTMGAVFNGTNKPCLLEKLTPYKCSILRSDGSQAT